MPDGDGRGISRRSALTAIAAAGVAAALPPLRRAAAGDAGGSVPAFELEETTLEELARAMDAGKLSSEELCRRYLERIRIAAALEREIPKR